MRYYKVDRIEGKYRILIYKILFSIPVQVFVGYTVSVQAINEMLNHYRETHAITLQTYYSLQAGR